jgi:hypothetical protein
MRAPPAMVVITEFKVNSFPFEEVKRIDKGKLNPLPEFDANWK